MSPLLVYPNPTQGEVTIITSACIHDGRIQVRNGDGQLIMRKLHQQGRQFLLDISFLPRGVYFIEIEDEGKSSAKVELIR